MQNVIGDVSTPMRYIMEMVGMNENVCGTFIVFEMVMFKNSR